MGENLTEEKLEEFLGEQTKTILNAVDHKFARIEVRLQQFETRIEGELSEIRKSIQDLIARQGETSKSIQELTATLNKYIERVEAQESKVEALYSKVEKITSFLKEKFGAELAS